MNTTLVFLGVAIVGAILAVGGLVVFFRSHFHNDPGGADTTGSSGPFEHVTTPVEKRAWWGLGIGIVMAGAIAAEFIAQGTTGFFDNRELRLTVTAILLAGMAAYVILLLTARRKKGQQAVIQDERDRVILSKAPAVQLVVVLFSIAVWAIALTEVYWEQGTVPIVFPYMIFWSAFIIKLLTGSIAILVGYRRM